jgi:hypothetical protein
MPQSSTIAATLYPTAGIKKHPMALNRVGSGPGTKFFYQTNGVRHPPLFRSAKPNLSIAIIAKKRGF